MTSERATQILNRNGLKLEPWQVTALASYAELLKDWNKKINLISRNDEENIWGAHILHSLSLLFHLRLPAGLQVLDLGTGGGLPGIPLAIARPDLHVTLLDSIRKKTLALEDITARLPVGNLQVVNARAEELARDGKPARLYAVVVSRAVAPLVDLLKWTSTLLDRRHPVQLTGLAPSGEFPLQTPFLAALKGGDLEKETRGARLRYPGVRVTDISLNFEGSSEAGLEEKKLLIAIP